MADMGTGLRRDDHKLPNSRSWGLDHDARTSIPVTSVTPSENFFESNITGLLTDLLDVLDRSIDLLLPNPCFGNVPSDGLSMLGDDNSFAMLHLIEQPGRCVLASEASTSRDMKPPVNLTS